jgi:hypothetical protein
VEQVANLLLAAPAGWQPAPRSQEVFMIRHAGVAVLAAATLFAAGTQAHGFGVRQSTLQHASHYCQPVTVVCVPICALQAVPLAPAAMPQKMYAIPKPAPASKTSEPPVNPSPKPIIRDSQFLGGTYTGGENCKVGFWNLSGRDLTIKVNGTARVVPRDRAVVLDLRREFVWHAQGREPQRVLVPPDKGTHEIVLR